MKERSSSSKFDYDKFFNHLKKEIKEAQKDDTSGVVSLVIKDLFSTDGLEDTMREFAGRHNWVDCFDH